MLVIGYLISIAKSRLRLVVLVHTEQSLFCLVQYQECILLGCSPRYQSLDLEISSNAECLSLCEYC